MGRGGRNAACGRGIGLLVVAMISGVAFVSAAQAKMMVWAQTSAPPRAPGSQLVAVGASSATNVWAVGGTTEAPFFPEAARWNGTKWVGGLIDTIRPHGGDLSGVSALSPTAAWAVGEQNTPDTGALVLFWNGTKWAVQKTPYTPGQQRVLRSVSAVSATDVWAVGTSSTGSLIEHFNGSTWSVVQAPPGSELVSVKAISATDVWAVGGDLVDHYDGHTWSTVSVPMPPAAPAFLQVNRVYGSNDVWIVGGYNNTPISELYNGSTWTMITPPFEGYLQAVAAISADNVWATGFDIATNQPIAVHWTGGPNWTIATPSALANANILALTRVPDARELFGVGVDPTTNAPLAADYR